MSTQHQESNSQEIQGHALQAEAEAAVEGYYTGVAVHPNLGGSGNLLGGTGTMSAIGVFSCGPFAAHDLPQIGMTSNITGNPNLNLAAWKCVASGPTSDFKAKG